LAEDGRWTFQDVPKMPDIAGRGGVLYGVSTAPDPTNGTSAAVLSRSTDGGRIWEDEVFSTPTPPTPDHEWVPHMSLQVEAVGDTTLALVTTSFSLARPEELFPEMRQDPPADRAWVVEERPDGVRLGTIGRDPGELDDETVRVIPWAGFGADPSAVAADTVAWVARGDGRWEQEDQGVPPLGGYPNLSSTAAEFLVTTYANDGSGRPVDPTVFGSPDARTWTEIDVPADHRVAGLGSSTLVAVPWAASSSLQFSSDRGEHWTELPAGGIAPDLDGLTIQNAATGPLGLALLLGRDDGAVHVAAVTADLVHWEVLPLDEQVDAAILGSSVLVGADQVVVSTYDEQSRVTTLIGTPTR
jgi:hypothetical protein